VQNLVDYPNGSKWSPNDTNKPGTKIAKLNLKNACPELPCHSGGRGITDSDLSPSI
jgi:hypothetical protein